MSNNPQSWAERLFVAAIAVLLAAWMLHEAAVLLEAALPILGGVTAVVLLGIVGHRAWKRHNGIW